MTRYRRPDVTLRCLPRWAGLALVLAAGAALWGCSKNENGEAGRTQTVIPFRADGQVELIREGSPYLTIDIEIADTDSARVRGMMQRSSFPPNSGMLFIFPYAEMQSFWMANTPLALDIIFVGSDSTIVSIHKYTRPLSPDNVTSGRPAQFVLEVPAGFADSNGIVESDRLRWKPSQERD